MLCVFGRSEPVVIGELDVDTPIKRDDSFIMLQPFASLSMPADLVRQPDGRVTSDYGEIDDHSELFWFRRSTCQGVQCTFRKSEKGLKKFINLQTSQLNR